MSDLEAVKKALEAAQAAPDPISSLLPGISTAGDVIKVMAFQTSATNRAVLAWLQYQVSKEEENPDHAIDRAIRAWLKHLIDQGKEKQGHE